MSAAAPKRLADLLALPLSLRPDQHHAVDANGNPIIALGQAASDAVVRAINCHDDLLAALKGMVEYYGDHDDDFSATARAAAQAAIAKAEKEAPAPC